MSAQVRSQVGCSAPHRIDHPEGPRDAGKAPKRCTRRMAITNPSTPLPNRPDAATATSGREDIMGRLRSGGRVADLDGCSPGSWRRAALQTVPARSPYPRQAPCQSAQHLVGEPTTGIGTQSGADGWEEVPLPTKRANATQPARQTHGTNSSSNGQLARNKTKHMNINPDLHLQCMGIAHIYIYICALPRTHTS